MIACGVKAVVQMVSGSIPGLCKISFSSFFFFLQSIMSQLLNVYIKYVYAHVQGRGDIHHQSPLPCLALGEGVDL